MSLGQKPPESFHVLGMYWPQEGSETQVLWVFLEVTSALVFQQPTQLLPPRTRHSTALGALGHASCPAKLFGKFFGMRQNMSLVQCAWAVLSNAMVSVWAWDCGVSAGGVRSQSCRMEAPWEFWDRQKRGEAGGDVRC